MKQFNTMVWLAVVIILGCIFETVKGSMSQCRNCGCCDWNICDGDNCTHGCIDGKWGNKCYRKCPSHCKACERNLLLTGSKTVYNCNKCPDGRYIDSQTKDCSLRCPKRCKTCVSLTNCTECHSSYYNMGSVKDCSITCPVNCELCNSQGICSFCKSGFSGDRCDTCKRGKYGENCKNSCFFLCKDSNCIRSSGQCVECITDYFSDENCSTCMNGMHGTYCNQTCPENCKDGMCHRFNGNCSNGCRPNFSGPLCESCVTGKNGPGCTLSYCSTNCYDGQCNNRTGSCFSCKPNFEGEKCNDCKPGFYTKDCSKVCKSSRCKNSICHKTNGTCAECQKGMSGDFCNKTCCKGCVDNICGLKDGGCTLGCQQTFSGDKCCTKNGNCEICSSNEECQACLPAAASTVSSIVGPAVGGVAGFVVLISGMLVGFFFMRKRRMKLRSCRSPKKDEPSFDVSGEENNYLNVAEVGKPEPLYSEPNKTKKERLCKEQYNDNENENPPRDVLVETYDETVEQNGQDECYYNMTTNIKVTALFNYVMKKTKDAFKLEFSQLPKKLQKSCSFAKRPENVEKNRYNGIYPYDHSRVQVMGDPTFFVNANYIDGFEKEKMYIASLGPTKKTTGDFKIFWEMVWHEKADVIVMLTNLRELTGMKCEQYWPELNESIQFGDVTVSCNNVDNFAEYTARVFTVSKMTETRSLTHLHYTAWPDKDVPDNVTSLVEFRQRVNATPRSTTGAIIVHCSAGIGRTGTYIAMDRLVEEGEHTASVNVYGCILSMREQRMNMVQTLGQYVFLHKALVHSLTFDCKPIPAEAFVGHVGSMTDASYENQFQHLQQNIKEDSTEEQEAVIANSSRLDKNRKGADIPGNRYRPRLYLNRTYNNSDYINATNIDSFKKKNHFIIAQTPLPTTVQDFLTLTYQENCSCIVSMGNVADTEMDVGTYLPSDKQSLSKGCFTATCLKSETNSQYIQTILTIKNTGKQEAGEKTLCHFEYKGWKTGARVPGDAGDFVQFVKDVTSKANTSNEDRSPILVHCLNGVERSGLFCAVAVLLEKIQLEYRISIVNTLRQIMKRRTSAFGNKEQLEFCYNCLAAHLESNNVYANLVL